MANEKEPEIEPLVSPIKDEDGKEEMDVSPFIRVKMDGDDIFDQNDDVDDDDAINFDFYGDIDFDVVSSDSGCSSASSQLSRFSSRRKQELKLTSKTPFNEDGFIKTEPEEEQKPPAYSFDPGQLGMRRRDKIPLYLLNPDDYRHDPVKAMQIRRAIITYRHHQEKKILILKQSKEIEQLRKHLAEVYALALDLSMCGCSVNKNVDLSLLDKKIEKTLPRTFSRGGKEVLAVPFNQPWISLPSSSPSSAITMAQPQQEMTSVDYKKPESASSSFVNRPSIQVLRDAVKETKARQSLMPSVKKLEPSCPTVLKPAVPSPSLSTSSAPPKIKFLVARKVDQQIPTVQSPPMMNSPTSLYPSPPTTPPTASQLVIQARRNNTLLAAAAQLPAFNGKLASSPVIFTKKWEAPQSKINVGTSRIVPFDKDTLWKRMEEDDQFDSSLLLHEVSNLEPTPPQTGKRTRKQSVLARNNDNGRIESGIVLKKSFYNSEALSKQTNGCKTEGVDDNVNSGLNGILTIDLDSEA